VLGGDAVSASQRQFIGGVAGLGAAFALGGTSLSLLSGCTDATRSSNSLAFPPPDPSSPWWMQGVYAPVHEQVESHELSVRGSLPPELSGWFLRNGSNPVNGNSEHWFLGDGMIHSIRLENGRATTYRNRWVDTPIYRAGGGLMSAGPPGGPVGPNEGEGYIIGFVTDRRTMASSMVVLDAMNMKAGPVAWIDLPQRVPVGFHGAWMAEA